MTLPKDPHFSVVTNTYTTAPVILAGRKEDKRNRNDSKAW